MLRGEVRITDFADTAGSEATRRRPAVIVSNDHANLVTARLGRGVVTVVPVTSNVERVHPFQVLLSKEDSGLARDSKAQAEQIRAVDVSRLGRATGRLPVHAMAEIDDAIRLHLDL